MQQDGAQGGVVGVDVVEMVLGSPATMSIVEAFLVVCDVGRVLPALQRLFSEAQEDTFTTYLSGWNPEWSLFGQTHNVIFGQFFLFGEVDERFDAGKPGESAHFAQAVNQDDLLDDLCVGQWYITPTGVEIIRHGDTVRIFQDIPFRAFQIGGACGRGCLCLLSVSLFGLPDGLVGVVFKCFAQLGIEAEAYG